jgi:hypothetical protein
VGDVALAHSLALYGAGAGLLLGAAMDPPHNEAYTLNGAIGTVVGLSAGLLLAPRVETTRRRMLWVDAGAAAGALAPWLLYPLVADEDASGDEQAIGLLSGIGLVGGAVLAWYLTRDRPDADAATGSAPRLGALLERSGGGTWMPGVPLLRPVRPRSEGRSLGFDALAGRF